VAEALVEVEPLTSRGYKAPVAVVEAQPAIKRQETAALVEVE
jgi:hypothetical protein